MLLQNPFVKKIWVNIREQIIFRKHESVARYWRTAIRNYKEEKTEKHNAFPKTGFDDQKIIWQYWGQGLNDDTLPEVVKICFASIDRFKRDYRVIRLTDETLKDYIDFPQFVWEKRNNPEFKTVFFSDLLRVALLQNYGGIWLDATVLLSDEIPYRFRTKPFFAFQRSKVADNKATWKSFHPYYWSWDSRFKVNMLNSIIIGSKGEPITLALLHLLLHYWKTQDKILNYFFFQILYHELMRDHLKSHKFEAVDDTLPHLLQSKIFKHQEQLDYLEIFALQSIHKLTYFSGSELAELVQATRHLDLQQSGNPI